MNKALITVLFLTSLFLTNHWTASAAEHTDVFGLLEAKIEAQLKKGDLHQASVAAIRAQWAEYKKAHTKPINQGEFRGAMFACGLACPSVDVKSITEYSGGYVFKTIAGHSDAPGPHLEIEVSDDGRVFVLRDSRRIPAVVNNKIIFFTDGVLVREKALFGTKVFASLKIKMIYRAEHAGLVMGPTDAYFDNLSRLLRFERETEEAEDEIADHAATSEESKGRSQPPNSDSTKVRRKQ